MRASWRMLTLVCVAAAVAMIVLAFDLLVPGNWALLLVILVSAVIFAFIAEFEGRAIGSKEIALVAILGAVSAASRLPFAGIPNVQPCTYIILCVGYVFGPTAAFMTATITVMVSNVFLGHGPWTPFQIFAWGLVGASGHLLRKLRLKESGLILWGGACGYMFGLIMNLWIWTAFVTPLTPTSFIFTSAQTFWFDTAHAIGNFLFLSALGWRTVIVLERYKTRFHIDFRGNPLKTKAHQREG